MSHDDIATALQIARGTLTKHFEQELSVGALQRRMEILSAMHATAKKGNVAAQKAYIAMTPASAVPPPLPEPKVEPKGKKEIAQDEAKVAQRGTTWEALLAPASPVQ